MPLLPRPGAPLGFPPASQDGTVRQMCSSQEPELTAVLMPPGPLLLQLELPALSEPLPSSVIALVPLLPSFILCLPISDTPQGAWPLPVDPVGNTGLARRRPRMG